MSAGFSEKHYLVLGAAGGIGSCVSHMLSEAGATLTLAGRTEETVASLADKLGATSHTVDGRDFSAVESLVEECGELDGIVNCIGSVLLKPAHLTDENTYDTIVDTNLKSAFATVRTAGKFMRKGGSIVLLSSAAAMHGLTNHEAIAAAKAGIIGLTMSAAASYAGTGLRINAVAPGLTQTPMTEKITANDAARKVSESMHALGRLGEPEDIARAILFFLDSANSWVSGQVLGIDGGLSRLMPKIKV